MNNFHVPDLGILFQFNLVLDDGDELAMGEILTKTSTLFDILTLLEQ